MNWPLTIILTLCLFFLIHGWAIMRAAKREEPKRFVRVEQAYRQEEARCYREAAGIYLKAAQKYLAVDDLGTAIFCQLRAHQNEQWAVEAERRVA